MDDRTRMADRAVAARALGLPVSDGAAEAVSTADLVMGEDGPATWQVTDNTAAMTVIGAGG